METLVAFFSFLSIISCFLAIAFFFSTRLETGAKITRVGYVMIALWFITATGWGIMSAGFGMKAFTMEVTYNWAEKPAIVEPVEPLSERAAFNRWSRQLWLY